jgi:leader peptidase (prepilin peptidase)/N-methyltransferase
MAVQAMEAPRITGMMGLVAVLVLSLLVISFLPDQVAAQAAVRTSVIAYLTIAAIDFVTKKVPNVLIYPTIVYTWAATAIVDVSKLPEALLGAGVVLAIMFVLAILGKGAMGMGDVKAACLGGSILGWPGGVIALLFGFGLGAVVSIPLLVLRLRDRRDSVPLTPFLAGGMLIYGVMVRFLLTPVL